MKKLFSIVALLFTIMATSQTFDDDYRGSLIGLQITQDGKLFVMEDDHGNKPVTWDIHTKLTFEGYEKAYGHLQLGLTTEYADLIGGSLFRFGVEGGYEFTKLPVPFTNIKYSIAPLVGAGMLYRFDERYVSLELSVEVAFVLTKEIHLIILNTYTERSDVSAAEYRYNLAFGFQINLDTNYIKKNAK